MLIQRSKAHLKEANKTYFPHGWFAVKAGGLLLYAGLTSLVHGVVPAFFPFLSRDIVRSLADRSRGEEAAGSD